MVTVGISLLCSVVDRVDVAGVCGPTVADVLVPGVAVTCLAGGVADGAVQAASEFNSLLVMLFGLYL